MPLWFHIDESLYMKQMTNQPTAKCLREHHGVNLVGQLSNKTKEHGDNHTGRPTCQCPTCKNWRAARCHHPHQCRETGKRILASILEKWNPNMQNDSLDFILLEEEKANNKKAITTGQDVTFERRITVDKIDDTICIFTPKERRVNPRPENMIRYENQHITDAWVMSQTKPNKAGTMTTTAVAWFGPGDTRNQSF
jgi:hypothetical protein